MAGVALLPPLLCLRRSPGHGRHHQQLNSTTIFRRFSMEPSSHPNIRFAAPPRSSPRRNPSPELKPKSEPEFCEKSPVIPVLPSFPRAVTRLINRIGEELKADTIWLDIISIGLPALLALAADPITSLVDTAFVGHLGSVDLAAVGVSVSVFNLVSKLFNIPLLNITTSFVAEERAQDADVQSNTPSLEKLDDQDLGLESMLLETIGDGGGQHKKFLPAVSTSLALAVGFGIVEAIVLSVGSGFLMNIMGVSVDSPMREPAEQFLSLRSLGAPPIVIALAAQGAFRGFMDTKTPLYAVGAGNLLNAILDPILIFLLGLGIGGAAISTVISEYLIAFILIWKLNEKVLLIPPNIDAKEIVRYLKSGGLLIGRTIAILITMTLSTSMAAREGPIHMAGHQICLQVWLAVSLLNDALALAGQALLANAYTQGNYKQARLVVYRVMQMGLVTGIVLAVIMFLGFGAFSYLFTTDSAVLDIAQSGVLFVTVSQPMNAIAFVLDGLYYGVSDFAYAAYSMVFVALLSSLFLLVAAPIFGLAGVWTGLFLFMTLRVVAGFYRLGSKNGPWKMIWSDMEMGILED